MSDNIGRKRFGFLRAAIAALISLLLAAGLLWLTDMSPTKTALAEADAAETSELNVHFVDVGQGDACVVELPDGKNMLIDSGSSDSKNRLINYIDENIKDDEGKTIEYFDIAIVTHSDSDHCGEMGEVLTRFPAKTFYRPNQESRYTDFTDPGKDDLYGNYGYATSKSYKTAIEAGYKGAEVAYSTNIADERQNLIVPEGKSAGDEGYYSVTFYAPLRDRYTDDNDYSPIIILEYEDNRVTLSGDAEKTAEEDFVAKAKEGEGRYSVFTDDFTVQAIKLGHHGSRTSSSADYLETMTSAASRPNVQVVISCGTGNSYGHPHEEVLTRLAEMGFSSENILRTDRLGNIVISVRYDAENERYSLFVGDSAVDPTPDNPDTPDNPETPDNPPPKPPEHGGSEDTPRDTDGTVEIFGMEIPVRTLIIVIVVAAVVIVVVMAVVLIIRSRKHQV